MKLPKLPAAPATGRRSTSLAFPFSVVWNPDGRVIYEHLGPAVDRFEGNTKGKVAVFGLLETAGVPLDVRHVLSGECAAGASAEERAHAAALLRELEAKLPLGADAHEGAGRHESARPARGQHAAECGAARTPFGVALTQRACGLRAKGTGITPYPTTAPGPDQSR